jgi:hypothetical protein
MGADFSHRIPPLRRARGYRLYDYQGRRYLDLWQGGGRALLGHRSFRLTHLLKDVIARGLLADLPSPYGRRLERALAGLLPAYPQVRIASCLPAALGLAGRFLGREVREEEIPDPALDPVAGGSAAEVAWWRPLLAEDRAAGPAPRVLLPVLPFAASGAPVAVCFSASLPVDFPPSETVSPVLLAGATRCLYDLRRYRWPEWYRDDLLQGAAGWSQRGIYLRALCPAARYGEIFAAFLQRGVLLNPHWPGPSILPGEASAGELAKMIQLFREYPGE